MIFYPPVIDHLGLFFNSHFKELDTQSLLGLVSIDRFRQPTCYRCFSFNLLLMTLQIGFYAQNNIPFDANLFKKFIF